jgi:lysophospholipase L1-like esterase
MRPLTIVTAAATVLAALVWIPTPAAAADCSRTHTGRIPLTDLATGTYMGHQGGLYPGGVNQRPTGHDSAGLFLANNRVEPRNASGAVDQANGKIGLISIGMSNTTQEFQQFITIARSDPAISPKVSIVDGAQGSQDAIAWATPNAPPWTVLANRLAQAGVAPAQVQVVWLKQQIAGDNLGAFPAGAQTLRDRLRDIVTIARSKYPNLRIAYLSSRSYGDYNGPLRGTGAYEQAFGVKFLIRDQINGDTRLSYTDAGPAPWLAWSTYLWADGLGPDDQPGGIPGRSDGLEWLCSDYQSDGIHPSPAGRTKVATKLLAFLKADTTATPWFHA